MTIQFAKNQTFSLRSVSLYDSPKAYRAEDGSTIFKAGEPSQKGIVYPDHTEVTAIAKFEGGGWLCSFPNGELGYVDPNKIMANHLEAVAKKEATGTTVVKAKGNGHAAAPSSNPLEELKAARAAKAAAQLALQAADARIAKATALLQEMNRAAQELMEAKDEVRVLTAEEQAEKLFEQA